MLGKRGTRLREDYRVTKPGLVFRAGGKAGQEVLIDNVKVWELK